MTDSFLVLSKEKMFEVKRSYLLVILLSLLSDIQLYLQGLQFSLFMTLFMNRILLLFELSLIEIKVQETVSQSK